MQKVLGPSAMGRTGPSRVVNPQMPRKDQRRYDARQRDFEALLKQLKGKASNAFTRPGSRNPKKIGG